MQGLRFLTFMCAYVAHRGEVLSTSLGFLLIHVHSLMHFLHISINIRSLGSEFPDLHLRVRSSLGRRRKSSARHCNHGFSHHIHHLDAAFAESYQSVPRALVTYCEFSLLGEKRHYSMCYVVFPYQLLCSHSHYYFDKKRIAQFELKIYFYITFVFKILSNKHFRHIL